MSNSNGGTTEIHTVGVTPQTLASSAIAAGDAFMEILAGFRSTPWETWLEHHHQHLQAAGKAMAIALASATQRSFSQPESWGAFKRFASWRLLDLDPDDGLADRIEGVARTLPHLWGKLRFDLQQCASAAPKQGDGQISDAAWGVADDALKLIGSRCWQYHGHNASGMPGGQPEELVHCAIGIPPGQRVILPKGQEPTRALVSRANKILDEITTQTGIAIPWRLTFRSFADSAFTTRIPHGEQAIADALRKKLSGDLEV